MIDLEPDPELALLQETARRFAERWLRPRERAHEAARAVADEVHESWDEIGLGGVELPQALGGAGLGALVRALVLEELAAADAGAVFALDRLGPAGYALQEGGGEDALRRFALPLLETPGARAVLALDPARPLRVAQGRVHGSLAWVPADRVDLLLVVQRDEILVVREGIALEPLPGAGLRCAGASALRLEAAPLVARFDTGAARARARARLYGAALLVGVMRASVESSRAYALERVAFGRPIAHHQALAFLLTDMATALEGARLLLWDAALRLDRGEPAEEACATAFVEAAEQALFVTPNGVQVLGGHGFMQDYPLEKWMREGRALGLCFGGPDPAREQAGAELAAQQPPIALVPAEA